MQKFSTYFLYRKDVQTLWHSLI